LLTTEPHFIRALKPNSLKKPDNFDAVNALRQLRYAGLLETIRIRSAGYSVTPTYEEFYHRFKIIVENADNLTAGKDARGKCEVLLNELNLDMKKFQMGVTKIFLKEAQNEGLMKLREEKLSTAVLSY